MVLNHSYRQLLSKAVSQENGLKTIILTFRYLPTYTVYILIYILDAMQCCTTRIKNNNRILDVLFTFKRLIKHLYMDIDFIFPWLTPTMYNI